MKLAKALLLPAALIVLAEIGARAAGTSDCLAPPSESFVAFGEAFADGSLLSATRDTLFERLRRTLHRRGTRASSLGVALGLSAPSTG